MSISSPSLYTLRLSAAYLTACAVRDLYPSVLLAGGGTNEEGFYYDFVFEKPFDQSQIEQLEERIRSLMTKDLSFTFSSMMKSNAATFFQHHKQFLRAEVALDFPEPVVELCHLDDFFDLCPVNELFSTKKLATLKILSIEKNIHSAWGTKVSITRILGTCFHDKNDLKEFLKNKRKSALFDHRVLGEKFGLFQKMEENASNSWIWLEKGSRIRALLASFCLNYHQKKGLKVVELPTFVPESWWRKRKQRDWNGGENGENEGVFWEHEAYIPVSSLLPQQVTFYQSLCETPGSKPRGIASWGVLWNTESEESLGLLRSMTYHSDAGSLFCSPKDVLDEVISSLQFIDKIIRILDFTPAWILRYHATKNSSAPGNQEAELLKTALEKVDFTYQTVAMDGKQPTTIECVVFDSLKREWKVSTVRLVLDYVRRFGLSREQKENQNVILVEQTLISSAERLISLLLEKNREWQPFLNKLEALLIGENLKSEELQLIKELNKESSFEI